MQIEENKICCGCGACANVCPKSAIEMKEDERGFLKPVINKDLCIECGMCGRTCPMFNFKSENIKEPKVFAFVNKNDEDRANAASGGVFTVFAKPVITRGGVVFGVAWDENMKASHTKAERIEDLKKMQSSKYVQADTNTTYTQAKSYLETGREVLYTGTPCQIAGLKSYLKKDYENLLTIEVLCHGVPSRKVFEMFKKEFMKDKADDERILNINFRSKAIYGWNINYMLTTTTTTGIYNLLAAETTFLKAFLSNICLNDSCHDCQFNKLPRTADLTMADFWGVENYDDSLNDKKGISIILVNSPKGQARFEEVRGDCSTKEVPPEYVIKYNPNIIGSSKPHKNREKFFKDILKGKTLEKTVNKYVKTYPNLLKFIYKKLLPPFIKNIVKRFI